MLTEGKIKQAKHSGIGNLPMKLGDGNGLQLHVFPTGRKSWLYSYRFEGKQKTITIGKYPQITLINARSMASNLKRQQEENPFTEPTLANKKKRIEKVDEMRLFKNVTDQWFKERKVAIACSTYKRNIGAINKHVIPKLGNKHIDDITDEEILKIATDMQVNGTKEMAKRVVRLIGQIYKFARVRLRITKHNPSLGLIEFLETHKSRNMPRISILELPKLIMDIEQYRGEYISICAIKLMMLCFVRTSELRGMRWQEIDWENKMWRIPAERMKGKRIHIVPLSEQVIAILENLKEYTGYTDFVFYSSRCKDGFISSHTILGAIKRMGYSGKMTGHGFRGLASTFLHEKGFLSDAIERQLAHTKIDRISAAYDHSTHLDKRQEMMQYWSDYITSKGLKPIKLKYIA
ncbi:site-specific integrase [Acinetobacter seifertii]|uniref:Site-specific integrase n=1 Tax=Acinetobacter seifertii TaxID=1530123 RepID=A0A5E9PHW5_9GAMM|nr:site-specific integrase [Acinetobacter seifertii]TEU27189.1 site-specific integrase [Acinetobacter seifertii]